MVPVFFRKIGRLGNNSFSRRIRQNNVSHTSCIQCCIGTSNHVCNYRVLSLRCIWWDDIILCIRVSSNVELTAIMLGKMTAPWGIAMFWRRRAFPADIDTFYSKFPFKQLTLDCEGSTAAGFTCSRAICE